MNEPDLFNKPMAAARAVDPSTSHLAASNVESKGTAATQRLKCFEAVKKSPGLTATEMTAALGFLTHKRLPELRKSGLIRNGDVRRCAVTGQRCVTWWPVV